MNSFHPLTILFVSSVFLCGSVFAVRAFTQEQGSRTGFVKVPIGQLLAEHPGGEDSLQQILLAQENGSPANTPPPAGDGATQSGTAQTPAIADGCIQELKTAVDRTHTQMKEELEKFVGGANVPPVEIVARLHKEEQRYTKKFQELCATPAVLRDLSRTPVADNPTLVTSLRAEFPACTRLLSSGTSEGTGSANTAVANVSAFDAVTVAVNQCREYIESPRGDMGGISLLEHLSDTMEGLPIYDMMHKRTMLFDGAMADLNAKLHVFQEQFGALVNDLDVVSGRIGGVVVCEESNQSTK